MYKTENIQNFRLSWIFEDLQGFCFIEVVYNVYLKLWLNISTF